MRRILIGGLAVLSLALLAHAGWIHAKGHLGQWLMARAWAESEPGIDVPEPWPGARTRPIARLVMPELQIDRLVLEGIDLPNLAWGPGLAKGYAGHRIIAGHRDTHFRFLGDLDPGDPLELRFRGKPTERWTVASMEVVDSRTRTLDLDAPGPLLTLITCYPLQTDLSATPHRLVVSAVPADAGQALAPENVAWRP